MAGINTGLILNYDHHNKTAVLGAGSLLDLTLPSPSRRGINTWGTLTPS
jgi:hypothetical protein